MRRQVALVAVLALAMAPGCPEPEGVRPPSDSAVDTPVDSGIVDGAATDDLGSPDRAAGLDGSSQDLTSAADVAALPDASATVDAGVVTDGTQPGDATPLLDASVDPDVASSADGSTAADSTSTADSAEAADTATAPDTATATDTSSSADSAVGMDLASAADGTVVGDGASSTDLQGGADAAITTDAACGEGYVAGDGGCVDEDGCALDPCFAGVECADVPAPGAGRVCGLCPDGFVGDGSTCLELADCSLGQACDPNAGCVDVGGGLLRCACNAGWRWDGSACVDVDECAAGTFSCDAHRVCQNTPGGYACPCEAGYWGDEVMCSKTVTSCASCQSAVTDCDWINSSVRYACVCLPGYLGGGVATDPCVATGFALAWDLQQASGYVGQCWNGLDLVNSEDGEPAPFAGETLDVSAYFPLYEGADCQGDPVYEVVAGAGAERVTLSGLPSYASLYMELSASNQVLGRASTTVGVGDGPATQLAFVDTAAVGTTTGCMPGKVTILKEDGSPAVEPTSITVLLSSTDGETLFAGNSTCVGAAATATRSISYYSPTVNFYWKSATGSITTDTLVAEDQAGVLAGASHDVSYALPAPSGIAFGASYYDFEDYNTGACHQAAVRVVDAGGVSINTPTNLAVTLSSSDPKLSFYSASGCSGPTTSVTVAANTSTKSFWMRASAFGYYTVTGSSTLGDASVSVNVRDHCNHSGCLPSGHSTCGSCSRCCSGVCGSSCY